MPADEGDFAQLKQLMAQVFDAAQRNAAAHRKLSVNLATLQRKAASANVETWFNGLFITMIMRVLPVKKGDICADRVVKFAEAFMTHIEQHPAEMGSTNTTNDDDDESTLESRFAEFIISYLLKGTNAKDKVVRFRSCQLIAIAIRQLGEISDDAFDRLKFALCKRVYDKESSVRLQAVLALSRLQGAEEEDEDTVTRLLVSILQHDSSADVRRAVLYNLTKTPKTIPYLLQRAWDVQATNRRCVYARTLKEIGDFRLLSIGMREQLLAWGLKDRDTGVRAAATKMLVTDWLATANNDLVELLERLDIMNSQIGRTAMMALFEQRKDTLDRLEFPDELWRSLTAETAFLASCFNAYCVENGHADLAETKMPELTKLAFLVQEYLGLLARPQSPDEPRDKQEIQFIIEQLLTIAATCDFGDEIGRRQIVSLLREALVTHTLNEAIIQKAVEIIRKLAIDERDFTQSLLELVTDIRDGYGGAGSPPQQPASEDDSFQSAKSTLTTTTTATAATNATSESAGGSTTAVVHELVAVLRCLSVAQSGLELLSQTLDDTNKNVYLASLLEILVLPAVRNHEPHIRERGIRCLGLACLLSKQLAIENLLLFGQCYAKGHDTLRIAAIKIVTDILVVHGTSVLDTDGGVDTMSIYKMYYRTVRNPDEPELQAVAAEALCKLLLGHVFAEEDLVKTLVVVYFDASSAHNAALRQILTFCLPVYAYSHMESQQRLAAVAVDSLRRLTLMFEQSPDDEMVNPTQMAQQLVDWTDPQKLVGYSADELAQNPVHIQLANDMLLRLVLVDSKDERRALCSALSKLRISPRVSLDLLNEAQDNLKAVSESETVTDAVSRNALARFEAALSKAIVSAQELQQPAQEAVPEPAVTESRRTTLSTVSTAA